MKALIICDSESGRRIDVDNVKELCIVINDGLMIGIGTAGMTVGITPTGLPTLASTFNYSDFLKRLLT